MSQRCSAVLEALLRFVTRIGDHDLMVGFATIGLQTLAKTQDKQPLLKALKILMDNMQERGMNLVRAAAMYVQGARGSLHDERHAYTLLCSSKHLDQDAEVVRMLMGDLLDHSDTAIRSRAAETLSTIAPNVDQNIIPDLLAAALAAGVRTKSKQLQGTLATIFSSCKGQVNSQHLLSKIQDPAVAEVASKSFDQLIKDCASPQVDRRSRFFAFLSEVRSLSVL